VTVKDRILCGVAALAPALVTLALVGHFWTAGPRDFAPTWNDEIIYWTEIASFAAAGFDCGYFTVHEQPARLALSPFGAHGPLFPVLFGSMARVLPWRAYSAFAFNLVLITLAAGVWTVSARERVRPSIAVLFLASFWPIAFYLPSNMQEPLHFAIALAFGALLPRLSRSSGPLVLTACIVLLVVSSLLRPTWALLSIPMLWMWLRSARPRAIPLGIAFTAAAYAAFNWLAAPFPNSLNALIAHAPTAPVTAARDLGLRTLSNAVGFFSPGNGTTAEVFLRFEVAAVLAYSGCMLWFRREERHVAITTVLILGPPVAAVMVVGWVESWRDFRAMAPALLAALLVAGIERPRWLQTMGVANVAIGLMVVPAFLALHEPRFARRDRSVERFAQAVSPHIVFERNPRRWEDTVLMHVDLVQQPVLGLPPGIGLSFVLDWGSQPLPPRSRYLLLRREEATRLRPHVALTPLADTTLGTLYLNESRHDAMTTAESRPSPR
jgi:hypothetical protein